MSELFEPGEVASTPPAARLRVQKGAPLSSFQQGVLEYLRGHGTITLQRATELFGRNLYTNAGQHVGARLKRMLDRGLIVRVERGRYQLNRKGGVA